MPASAMPVEVEINREVRKVDECSHAFAKHWEQHARVAAGVKDKEKHASELKKLIGSLRQHKTQLRKWSVQASLPAASKDKLKAAQAKIERDVRRYQELETALKNQVTKALGQESIGAGDGAADMAEELSSPEEVKVQWDQLLRDGTEEDEMLGEFICKICQVHVVGHNPVMSRCSHLYCGDCIKQWFDVQPKSLSWAQRAQAKGAVPCPVCKEPLKQETDLFPVCAGAGTESAFLYRMLSGLKIRCSNHSACREDGRCDWTGGYGSFQEHVRTCQNVPLGKPIVRQESNSSAPEGSSTAAPDSEAEDPQQMEEPATPPAEEDDADAEPAEPVAAAAEPASLTDLIRALVDLKVQEYQHKDVRQAQAVELVEAPTVAEPAAEPEAQASASAERVAVAVPYAACGPSQLTIAQGDLVDVLERSQCGWTWGRKVACGSEGWFPEWAITSF